jgi:glycosyltransferase involved in cell wall biosynthesis
MKIGMMSAWNETSGVSIHAELVGEQWIKAGHKLCVFSFLEEDFHGRCLVGEDQEYVTRCFGTPMRTNYLNPIPFLREDYEFFIVQDLGMLPMDKLAKIFPAISKRAKTVLVVHTNKLKDDPSFYQFDWDAIVCFDHRYKKFLKEVYPEDKIHIIPFPYHRWIEGAKEGARRKLGLSLDEKIIFVFGQKWRNMLDTVPALKELSKDYPIFLLILSGAQRVYGFEGLNIEIRKEVLEHEQMYDYLHASDATILGKHSAEGVVLSSTAHLVMGSGCPIVARDSNFFELLDKEVLKYRDLEEFKQSLISVFEEDERYNETREDAKRYVEKNPAKKVAEKFTDLFEML